MSRGNAKLEVGQLVLTSSTPPADSGFYKIDETTMGAVGDLKFRHPKTGAMSSALTVTSNSDQGVVLPFTVGMVAGLLAGDCREKSFAVLKTAINAGAAVVAFAGDSITENCNAIDEDLAIYGNYRDVVMSELRRAFPECAFSGYNFGLSGRVGSLFISGTYVGQSGTENPATGFKRDAVPWWGTGAGSTVGKSWKDHVKDTAPDLLVVAFGQNAETDSAIYAHLTGIKNEIATWLKVPSVLCIATFQPCKEYQDGRIFRRIARAYRDFAKKNGWGLLDVARVQSILRYGSDERGGNWRRAGTAGGTGTWADFYPTAGEPVVVSNSVANFPPNAYLAYPLDAHDVSITVTADMTNSTTNGRLIIYLRDETAIIPSSVPPGAVWVQWTSSSIKLFDGAAEIATATYTGGAATKCRVDIVDGVMTAYADGVAKVSARPNINFGSGRIRIGSQFGATGPLVVSNPVVRYKEPAKYAAVITDAEIFGEFVQGDAGTKYPYGGNGSNHPSGVGISTLYRPPVSEFVRAVQSAVGGA